MQEHGILFNIQKFSVNDGPGIRTVVFFKGCPLRCKWCANPESQLARVQLLWDAAKCLRCGRCVRCCPKQAICAEADGIRVQENRCSGCLACAEQCPARALTAEGERRTVQDVVRVCLQDEPFYQESGGGVTLSGGEALMQPEFCIALLKALKREGLHTAIETTGFAPEAVFRAALPYLDLLLFDIKHYDPEKHREGTGVSNELPLFNMRLALRLGAEVLPRLPVIPNYNDSLADAEGFVRRLREVGAKQVQLLPFHQFGERKYELLRRDYAMAHVKQLHPEDLEAYRAVFAANGIHAFF